MSVRRRGHKIRQKAKAVLQKAGLKAIHTAKGKKAKLSAVCAAALKDAAAHVAAAL